MIRADSRRDIGIELRAAERWAMAIDRAAVKEAELFEHDPVAVNDGGKIHYSASPVHRAVGEDRRQIGGVERRAAGAHAGCRDAAWRHQYDAERQAAALFRHVANPRNAGDVGDLMRIGDHAGNAARHDRVGEMPGRAKTAFDMNVRIDQAGRHKAPARSIVSFAVYAAPTPAIRSSKIAISVCSI